MNLLTSTMLRGVVKKFTSAQSGRVSWACTVNRSTKPIGTCKE